MARDLRNIGYNKNNYPDLCYYYGSDAVDGNTLRKDAQAKGRFYKTDIEPFAYTKLQLGNGLVENENHFIGKVETLDYVPDLRAGMYVVDQTGILFIVVPPVVSDDANKSKVAGRRPTVKTQFTLRGLDDGQ